MQHACTSAEGPRTTNGAVQSNRTNGHSDAAGARVGVCALPTEPVHTICRCSMRVRVRRAQARRAVVLQSNRTNGALATPLGPVWVYARYPLSLYIPSVDAACVYECGGTSHDEQRRAIKSHEWCHSDGQ
jgi:hypothetical protein